MPNYCCAYGCKNSSKSQDCIDRNVSFHRFPHRNPKLMKEWLVKIKRQDFTPSLSTKICSEHFENDCFTYQNFTKKRFLKDKAVPTIFIFNQKSQRSRTKYQFGMGVDLGEGSSTNNLVSAGTSLNSVDAEVQTDTTFSTFYEEISSLRKEVESLKQVMAERFSPEHLSDVHLSSFTGFNKGTFFKVFHFLNMEEDLECRTLTPLKQYFLFLIRLKTGLTLTCLSYIFEISVASTGRIFKNITEVMYQRLKEVETHLWPTDERMKESSPLTFQQHYPNCRAIIDCTEIEIQKPYNPQEQQVTFSNYKNTNTFKALVCIGPAGCVTYVSDLWSGCISDKNMFNQSKLPQLLKNGDTVLADKGFLIKEELKALGCKLVTPTYLKDKVQFSFQERMFNKNVSHMRVHVERAISRIKTYKYFEGPILYKTLYNLNEIFYVATMLTIFQKPLIAIDLNPESFVNYFI